MSNKVNHLATELQHWLYLKLGSKAPSTSEIQDFISKHFDTYGVSLKESAVNEQAKIASLFKPFESDEQKRMRELAGIPHKGNYV